MYKIMCIAVVVAVQITSTIGIVRSQTSNSPQLEQLAPSDFKNTCVYQALSDFSGKHYESTIYGRDLDGVAKWKLGKELPIGIPNVVASAQTAFKKQFPEFSQFKIVSVELVHLPAVDDWIFNVEFNGTNFATQKEGFYEDKKINVLVLLSGRVIPPNENAK